MTCYLRKAWVYGILASALFLGACHYPRPFDRSMMAGIDTPQRSVAIFFVDGLDQTRMLEMADAGRLPNISARFIDGGVGVEHAVTSMPSITYPNTVSLLTGVLPGHHDILGNRWFDRHTLTFRDYNSVSTFRDCNQDFRQPTLFEILGDQLTVNFQCHTRRGVTVNIDETIKNGLDWFLGRYNAVDRRAGYFDKVCTLAEEIGRWPMVTLHYFPGVDEIGHRHGSDSDAYASALEAVDEAVGEVWSRLVEADRENDTFLILVSDHGHTPTPRERTFDIADWIEECADLKLFRHIIETPWYTERLARLENYDGVIIDGAYRSIMLHLRSNVPGRGWQHPLEPEAAEAFMRRHPDLTKLEAVECVAYLLADGRIRVESSDGNVTLERRQSEGEKEYRMIPEAQASRALWQKVNGSDTFDPSAWHTGEAWLKETCDALWPNFVPQAVEMFDSPQTGDIVIFAGTDWGFAPRGRGGHGSCIARDMHIPMYFAGPGLPHGASIPCARIVDVVPTVLELLDEEDRLGHFPAIDGFSRADALQAARNVP